MKRPRGFTILELLIAMAIFGVLGSMVVFFMQQSLDIFYSGTRESAQLDRMDTVLPQIAEDLEGIYVGDDWTPPYVPDPATMGDLGGAPPPPPPPVKVRFRAGTVWLKDATEAVEGPGGSTRELACPFIAFVVADASEWSHALKRNAGEAPARDAVPLTPTSEDPARNYRATGGLMEVVWIAVPRADAPSILDLYRGWRSPVGDPEKSLLDPKNLDSRREIEEACRVRERGLLHFGVTLRRVFATSWDPALAAGDSSETTPYVGPAWDSTRAFNLTKEDPNWRAPLFQGPQSLGDPSDDVFPAYVRLEVTLAERGRFSDRRGQLQLLSGCADQDLRLRISDADKLLETAPGRVRHLKIDTEWMRYEVDGVDTLAQEVRVTRGARGTTAAAHRDGAWIHLGAPTVREVRLPVYRDRYAVRRSR